MRSSCRLAHNHALLSTVLGAMVLIVVSVSAPSGTGAVVPGPRLLLAFYYMWYGPDSFNSPQMADRPVVPYISDHPDVIARQVKEAKSAGIDGFISSWTGTGTETDANFPRLLDAAAANSFQATIDFETNFAMQHGNVAEQLRAALSRFTNHRAFLKWNGKPVIFFWSPQSLGGVAAWRQVRQQVDPINSQIWSVDTVDASYLDVFDSIHLFSAGKWDAGTNPAPIDARWRATIDNYNRAHGTQRLWAAGVIPGWDESRIRPPRMPAKVFPRDGGALYGASWQAAIASSPEWITITSYNEWFEDTQIEPSANYGGLYLDLTRQYASQWKNGPGPCDGGTFFAATGYAICRQMEPYWRKFGGLAQFGYPIAAPRPENSPTDGREYTVQYFERARFELHPENADPSYQVQLGLLGSQAHPPDARAVGSTTAGAHYFVETGHNVSSVFFAYWQSHGGLFVNGFPISEEFRELSGGRTYVVQYFERARFELHPENAAPYNVLLGFLGRESLTLAGGR